MKLAALLLASVVSFGAVRYVSTREAAPDVDPAPAAWARRTDALARARVFVDDSLAGTGLSLDVNPRDTRPFPRADRLRCTYVPGRATGTTPKFDCRLPDGDVVKVKYGRTPEIHAEVAATRLLAALGFGADHVSLVDRLDCQGCPPFPFRTRLLAEIFFLTGPLEWWRNRSAARTFETVAVERKFEAPPIVDDLDGWQWSELSQVRQDLGGASRADLDALRLVAVVLGHWDNKASNQRLVCLDAGARSSGSDGLACERPLVMLQDVGSTFGPRKLNQRRWSETRVWADEARCAVSMKSLPYGGATFVDAVISEAGRRELAARLAGVSRATMASLFSGAAFPGADPDAPGGWVDALEGKVRQIVDRLPCPE